MKAATNKQKKGLTDAELMIKYGNLKAPFKKAITKILTTKVQTTSVKAAQ
ncbi:MAG: hypothetical protein KF744_11575 [Taibaiella sp.]|nr:hypothetical protein [Taibaiella sp.]